MIYIKKKKKLPWKVGDQHHHIGRGLTQLRSCHQLPCGPYEAQLEICGYQLFSHIASSNSR